MHRERYRLAMTTPDVPTRLTDASASVPRFVVPFENGDRLPRSGFEKRYFARCDIKKAELIEGVVYMPSPVRVAHAEKHADLLAWLRFYSASTPGVSVLDNASVRLDLDNEPQPDVLMRIESSALGNSTVDADDYVAGAPELIAEIAASSVAYDLHDKLRVYRRNGVLEYIVWRVYERGIDWFALVDGEYEPLAADAAGILRSRCFPGLRLAAGAMLDGDFDAVLAELRNGTRSDEHVAFRRLLASNAS